MAKGVRETGGSAYHQPMRAYRRMLGLMLSGPVLLGCTFEHTRKGELCTVDEACTPGRCVDGLCQTVDAAIDARRPDRGQLDQSRPPPPMDARVPDMSVDMTPDARMVDMRPPPPDQALPIDMQPPPPDMTPPPDVPFGFEGEECGPPNTVCVLASADATLSAVEPNTAFGREPELLLTRFRERDEVLREDILIAFDLAPRAREAYRAELLLPTDDDNSAELFVVFVPTDWAEERVTWSTRLDRREGAVVGAYPIDDFLVVPLASLLSELDQPRFSVRLQLEENEPFVFPAREAIDRQPARLRLYFR